MEMGVFGYIIGTQILLSAATPGILAAIFGFRLFKNETVINVKVVVGIFSAIGAMFLATSLKLIAPDLFPESYERDVFMLIGTVVGISVYLFSSSFFLRCLNLGNEKPNTIVERVLLVLIALRLWLFISQIGEDYFPIEEDSGKIMGEPWLLILIFLKIAIPIAIPIFFYKSMFGWLDRRQAEQGSGQQPPPLLKSDS